MTDDSPAALQHVGGVVIGPNIDRSQPRPLLAVLDAKPGHADELRAMIVTLTRENRREPGCVSFIPYEADQFPGRFYLYEVFADADAFEVHLDTDHVKKFRTALSPVSSSGPSDLVQLIEIPVPATEATDD
jgi:quinol monooxygenase YgiN